MGMNQNVGSSQFCVPFYSMTNNKAYLLYFSLMVKFKVTYKSDKWFQQCSFWGLFKKILKLFLLEYF